MSKHNRVAIERLTDEVFIAGRFDMVDELVAADFVDHDPMPGTTADREGLRQRARMIHDAFTDMHVEQHRTVARGDLLGELWRVHGRHTGTFLGARPTGREVTIRGFELWRFSNGKIAERWAIIDSAGLWEQLGATPRLDRLLLAS